jgi:molybdopterin converting factor small subunit
VPRHVVELFGVPQEITELRQVEIELNDGASLGGIVAALRRKIPALEGLVIRKGEDRLTEDYFFNINGRFYFDSSELQIEDGDRIALLTIARGG